MSQLRIQDFSMAGVQAVLNQLALRIERAQQSAPPPPSRGGGAPVLIMGSPSSPSGPVSIDSVEGLRDELNRISKLIPGEVVDPATVTTPGVVQISVAPADPAHPIAVGINDPILKGGDGYVHTQSIVSNTWTIDHGLGFVPSIEMVDSAGTPMWPGVEHNHPTSPTITILRFLIPTSGTARLS